MKRYRNEHGSPILNELFAGKVESDRFITSHLTVLEANTVSARYLRRDVISLVVCHSCFDVQLGSRSW